MILCKCELNKKITLLSIILFIFLEISVSIPQADFSDSYSIFKFIAMVIMPAISTTVAYSYITKQVGYKPVIYYSSIISIYPYIIPIMPNVNTYIYSLILLLLPCIFMFIVYKYLKKTDDKEEKERSYYKNKYAFLGYVPIIIFVLLLIYFYSGYFKFWAITIATGSMKPNIQIGDLVVINQKIDKNKIKIGDVIAYKSSNSIIVHRVNNVITSNDEVVYTTKGDANENVDAIIISTDMILGRVEGQIPYLGLPTVWLHEMLS
jgi:signal peptidase